MVPRNWWNVQNFSDDKKWPNLTLFLKDVYNILIKGLTFEDNVSGALLTVEFLVTNTDTQIKHGLAFVPTKYLVVNKSVSLDIYDGVQSSNQQFIYLRSTVIGTAQIFVC